MSRDESRSRFVRHARALRSTLASRSLSRAAATRKRELECSRLRLACHRTRKTPRALSGARKSPKNGARNSRSKLPAQLSTKASFDWGDIRARSPSRVRRARGRRSISLHSVRWPRMRKARCDTHTRSLQLGRRCRFIDAVRRRARGRQRAAECKASRSPIAGARPRLRADAARGVTAVPRGTSVSTGDDGTFVESAVARTLPVAREAQKDGTETVVAVSGSSEPRSPRTWRARRKRRGARSLISSPACTQ
jgi:hypothetical protein